MISFYEEMTAARAAARAKADQEQAVRVESVSTGPAPGQSSTRAKPTFKTYFEEMEARERARAAKREAEQTSKAEAFATRTTPMTERLRRIIRAMPDSEKDKPRHIRWFCEQLKSKYSGGRKRAALHEVGPALAAIGWERRRLWLGPDVTFRVWWFPPGAPKADEAKEALQRARRESSPPKQRRKRVDWTPGCPLSPDQIAA